MTTPEFIDILQRDVLGPVVGSVVVNYNTIPGGDPNFVTIDDIAIVIGTDDLVELREATSITFEVPEDGTIRTINIENSINPLREVERGTVGKYYLYSIRTPQQRPVIAAPANIQETYDRQVSIEPTVSTGVYEYSIYNAIIGNSIGDRESSYRVDCDRSTTTEITKTNPTNISNILADTASPAQVQDSLYSDTGWINGRYEGTKLNPSNNSGTDPVLQGSFFEAAFFGIDVADGDIDAISSTDIVFKQYISSGKASPPKWVLGDPALVYSIDGTVVQISSEGKLRVKTTGDILHINSLGYLVDPAG
jgi:hypothetical protein